MISNEGEEADDDVGGGVLDQAQPFTGQLAQEEQADQGVAELEPRIHFHNFSPAEGLLA